MSRQERNDSSTQAHFAYPAMNSEGIIQTTIRIYVRRVEIFMWEVAKRQQNYAQPLPKEEMTASHEVDVSLTQMRSAALIWCQRFSRFTTSSAKIVEVFNKKCLRSGE